MSKTLIVSLSIAIVLVGGYFVIQKNLSKTPQTIEKITIAQAEHAGFALFYIAKEMGFFAEEGLDVNYHEFILGRDAVVDMLAGKADVALALETPVVRKIYEEEDLQIISSLFSSSKDVGILALREHNIAKIEDLRNKKIGVTKGTNAEFFLYSLLISEGIRLQDVVVVDTKPEDITAALKNNKLDAVAVWNPILYTTEQEFKSDETILFSNETYTEHGLLVTTEAGVTGKSEALKRLLKALLKAENLYKTDNQEALNTVVAELSTIPEENIRGTWDKFTPVLKLDNVLLTVLNREGQWFKDNGIYTTELPDFREAIFTDYLKSIKPEAVTFY